MGDFPRWVDREDVDSQAMFSAYLHYQYVVEKTYCEGETDWKPLWWGHLHMILHRTDTSSVEGVGGAIIRPSPQGVKDRKCVKRACSRCEHGVGGYQFRWYSRYWAKRYNELRRPTAWTAPEPGAETTEYPSLRLWTQRTLP